MSQHETQERVSNIVFGKRLQTADIEQQTTSNAVALAVLANDALSSIAYANEEILIVLSMAAISGFSWRGFQGNGISIPIAIAISLLIAIVTISYRQTIYSNPAGGGGYRVAKENLGEELAQITGASLLIDYTLTVAVSMSAGVANVISVAPALEPYRVWLTAGIIIIMAFINLRGVRESARLFSIPTYFYLTTMGFTLILGLIRLATGTLGTVTNVEAIHHNVLEPITLLLVLRAFSSGCTALTGIEAISNDTEIFRKPRARNAANTLTAMSVILIVLFMSVTVLANAIKVVPSHTETLISQLTRTIYGEGTLGYIGYLLTMTGAFAVLFMAANTAFAGFPQLAAMLSADGFLPHQLTYRGRRLVYSWGIYVLTAGAVFLIFVTGAQVTNLIPLFAIGVFLGFTFSQAGMTRRFWRAGHIKPGEYEWGLETKIYHDKQWLFKLLVSGTGALATFVVMWVFVITKFTSGAWVLVLLIPALVWIFFRIHRHYKETAARLRLDETPVFKSKPIVFDPEKHQQVALFFCDTWSKLAVNVVESILRRGVPMQIIHIDVDPRNTRAFMKNSRDIIARNGWSEDIIKVIEEPYRDLFQCVAVTLKQIHDQNPNIYRHVYIGAIRARFPFNFLHMSTDRFLRDAFLGSEDVSLAVKQMELERLPLPPDFKVTFEHAGGHHEDDQDESEESE